MATLAIMMPKPPQFRKAAAGTSKVIEYLPNRMILNHKQTKGKM